MNSKSKTTEDILREMREYADQLDNDGDSTGADFRDFANQLEEAMKREKVEAVTIAATKSVNLTDEKWRRDIGNATALREALEQVLEGFDSNVLGPIGDVPNDWEIAEAKRLCKVVEAALAAPARNCDRFATANDAANAWQAYSVVHRDRDYSLMAAFAWLFAPAESSNKKEGGAK